MYLDRLVINGFKSFAEKTEFKFEHPFVAIVGPNGSGKTNVADAMRWVMGEQALKLIRLKKPIDAIFAGSTERTRLGLAQVDLYLNNHDGRLKLDYPEVVISRRLNRAGESEYLINKTEVRLQDILMLLAQANFGQKSYGVIGQGMITDILNANPQDRKEFFDEATGVKEFQMKRDQGVNKLIRTEDNLVRIEDLLVEIEPRLESLSRQVKKLEKRQTVEQNLHEVQTQYYGSLLAELRQKLADFTAQQQERSASKQVTEEQLRTIEAQIDQIGRQASRTELYHELQQQYQSIVTEKNELLKDQAVIKGRMEVEHERTGAVDLAWLYRRRDSIAERVTTEQAEIDNLEQTVQHQRIQLQKTSKAQADVQHELTQLEQQLLNVKEELMRISETLSVPEIKRRLEVLFQNQEQFLRELLATASLEEFKKIQHQAQVITTELAELLDQLNAERSDETTLKQQEVQGVSERLRATAELKEKLLSDSTELRVSTETKQQTIQLLKHSAQTLQHELTGLQKDITEGEATHSQSPDATNARVTELQAQQQQLEQRIAALDENLATKKHSLDEFNQAEEAKQRQLLELQTQARQIQTKLNQLSNELQAIEIHLTKLATRQEDLAAEMSRQVDAVTQTAIGQWTKLRTDHDQLRIEIERLQHQLELIGGIEPETVQEHLDTKTRYDFLHTQAKDLRSTITSVDKIIDELDVTIKRQFDHSFKAIAKSFTKYFTVLFGGGTAKLEILTSEETEESQSSLNAPETTEVNATVESAEDDIDHSKELSMGRLKKKHRVVSGIDIIAQPPGKKLQSIHALSGGEKSMTAIALICAIIDANTPPFVVLDEVEAALDESNSEKFAAIVKHLSAKTQFIVISHNRSTMHQADVLFGVTMGRDGTSRILSVKLTDAEKMLAEDTAKVTV